MLLISTIFVRGGRLIPEDMRGVVFIGPTLTEIQYFVVIQIPRSHRSDMCRIKTSKIHRSDNNPHKREENINDVIGTCIHG